MVDKSSVLAKADISVKTYPNLSLTVMRRRKESEYRFWLLARRIDVAGFGIIPLKDLYAFVARHRLCTRRTLERALASSSPFYHKRGRNLWLVGVLKVAKALRVRLRHQPVKIPLADFASLEDLRASFLASYMAGKPTTIAIDTLAQLTGRSRRTIARYLRSPHITKSPNVMISERRPRPYLDPELADQGYYRGRVNGQSCLVKRMPNTYESDLETTPRGMARVERQRNSCITAESSPGEEDQGSSPPGESPAPYQGAPRRLYYIEGKRASRALQSLSPRESIYVRCTNRQEACGALLWRGYTLIERGAPIVSL